MFARTVLVILLFSTILSAQDRQPADTPAVGEGRSVDTLSTQPTKPADDRLHWLPFGVVQKTFPVAPKPLFLYVYEKTCEHCKRMDSAVFNRPEIARFVNENLTPVRLDLYLETPLKVRDSLMDEMAFRRLLSVVGVPAYYFFDTSGRIIGVLDSEMDLLMFKRMLIYIRGSHFFRTPWEKFLTLPEAAEAAVNKIFTPDKK